MSILEQFTPLFQPASIAVVGASATSVSGGNRFIRNLKDFGYSGQIIPIHPHARQIEGLPAYASLTDVPGIVDYAYVAVKSSDTPAVLRTARGKVRFAQVMSSGFSESDGDSALEQELAAAAREANVRLIGPNCLGVFSPEGRVTFTAKTLAEPGSIGVVSQSGGLGVDIIRRGQNRGLRFSGLVTIGNAADVGAVELIDYFLQDDRTRVIGLYLESTREGRRLFEVLRKASQCKPVILLKGGRTDQGQRAAASHTGALAGNRLAWEALGRQTGTPMVDSLDEFLDVLATMQCLEPHSRPCDRVVLFGNGGGSGVLGSDAFGRAGFSISVFGDKTLSALRALDLPAGSSVANPIDVPAGALQQNEGNIAGQIISAVAAGGDADALIIHVNMTVILGFRHVDMLGNIIRAVLRAREAGSGNLHIALVLRSDGDAETEERKRLYRELAMKNGVPVFDELVQAARGFAALRTLEKHRARRRVSSGGTTAE